MLSPTRKLGQDIISPLRVSLAQNGHFNKEETVVEATIYVKQDA